MKTWRLVTLHINLNFGLSVLRHHWKTRDTKLLGQLGIAAIIVLTGAIFGGMYYAFLNMTYNALSALGHGQAVLTMGVVTSSLFVVFAGLALVVSVFYFANDLDFLVSLPLQPHQVLAGKFATVLVNAYLIAAPFAIPTLVLFCIREGMGPVYWLTSALVFLLIPVLPLAVASVAVLFIMSVTNIGRYKDALRVVGLSFLLMLALGFNYLLSSAAANTESIHSILRDPEGLVRMVGRAYPPSVWATRALNPVTPSSGILHVVLFAAASAAGLALMMVAAHYLFYKGLIAGREVSPGRRLRSDEIDSRFSRQSSPIAAIARREVRILVRTPIFMFNSVAMLVILPLISLFAMVMPGSDTLRALIESGGARQTIMLGAAGFLATMGMFAPSPASAISREGKLFWISKMIPVTATDQLKGKLAYSFALTALAIPILYLYSVLVFSWSALEFAAIVVFGMAGSAPVIISNLLIDLFRPYLMWDDPQKAIKQNFNVVAGMVVGAAILFGLYQVFKAALKIGLGFWMAWTASAALSVLLALLMFVHMARISDFFYRRIQI
ncbi:MAG: hypothetical protein AB1497_11895 [Bacillota bacterium]